MSNKDIAFYRGKQTILVDFSASEISTDGSLVLLEKIERTHKLIKKFSNYIPDNRNQNLIDYTIYDQLKQRVFMLMLGYEDANDVSHLKNDPIFKDVLQCDLASQPTISRFENSLDKLDVFELMNAWLDNYVSSLKGRKEIIIDIDATDDPTYGHQQLTMFNGYYGQFMYNELFFHDGQTGQIILPVLRPGNSHSNKWYVSLLKRVIERIKEKYPNIKIIIRTDSGFSGAEFYKLVDDYNLLYATGIPSNEVLKKQTKKLEKTVRETYLSKKEKHQSFIGFGYKAKSWHKEQQCYAKVESTGKVMNIRYFSSNIKDKTAEQIYFSYSLFKLFCLFL